MVNAGDIPRKDLHKIRNFFKSKQTLAYFQGERFDNCLWDVSYDDLVAPKRRRIAQLYYQHLDNYHG